MSLLSLNRIQLDTALFPGVRRFDFFSAFLRIKMNTQYHRLRKWKDCCWQAWVLQQVLKRGRKGVRASDQLFLLQTPITLCDNIVWSDFASLLNISVFHPWRNQLKTVVVLSLLFKSPTQSSWLMRIPSWLLSRRRSSVTTLRGL